MFEKDASSGSSEAKGKSDKQGGRKSDKQGGRKSDKKGRGKSDKEGGGKSDKQGRGKSDKEGGGGKSDKQGRGKSDKKGRGKSDKKGRGGGKSDKKGYNALEKHVAFFDRNGDGVVYPWETYQGFRAIGTPRLGSAIAGILINMGLSQKTRPGKGFSPLFPIEVKNSRFGMHGSDTDVYDKDGRFVESKFEEIFKKHAHTNKNALTYKEIKQMLKTNRDPRDYAGWIAAYAEWKLLHAFAKDKNGMLTKEAVRGVYDGSVFKQLEEKRSREIKEKQR